MIAIYIDDEVIYDYYAVAAVLNGPVREHPMGWVRKSIEDMIKSETALLRQALEQELGNEHCDACEGS